MTRIIAVAPKDLGKFEKSLGVEFRRGQRQTFRTFGKTAAQVLVTWSVHIHDLGHFAAGWSSSVRKDGVRVYNRFSHAIWVEHGRGPGKQPPYEKIMPWVLRHITTMSPRSATFLLMRKIGREGVKPRPVMTSGWGQATLAQMWQTTMGNFWGQVMWKAR